MEQEDNQPMERISIGRVEAAVWENRNDTNVWHAVTFSRWYRDGEQSKNHDQFPHRGPASPRTAQPNGLSDHLEASRVVAGRE